ncbi:MAG: hypothetical protein KGN79_12660 [Acidobacteriota bacterium]|nr:hypothetical protein [Acidobacteriota bacterium]
MSVSDPSTPPTLVLVGGFLGAGKTSLIMAASRMLAKRGVSCAAILNDQGDELVDTRQVQQNGTSVSEVTGGCFCCQFTKLRESIDALRQTSPQVIFAEPVGSCTDIVATVLNPLRRESDLVRIAPFTVLVDPNRAEQMQTFDADPSMLFLWKKQLEEADIVCTTKLDRYPDISILPQAMRVSSKSGEGIRAWLDLVLTKGLSAGEHTLEIDYEEYAEAEAALSWTNLSMHLDLEEVHTPSMLIGPLLDQLDEALTSENIEIVHLKLMDTASTGWVKAAICRNGAEPSVDGDLDASPSTRHDLLLNLRAVGNPERVRAILERATGQIKARERNLRMDCFSPSPPQPEQRIPALATN